MRPQQTKSSVRSRPWPAVLALAVLSSSVSFAQTASAPTASAQKLNVLFIISDDLNCDLGCYGATEVKTPNIDRLATRGVRFDRAYCQFSFCCPSRSSFLTGRRPNATGVLANPSAPGGKRPHSPHFREHIPETITLPQLFRKAGWFSARVGKLYHYYVPDEIGTGGLDDPGSWDLAINPRGVDRDEQDKIFSMIPGSYGHAVSWLADEGEDLHQTDGIGATEAIKLLERFKRENRPFFLGVGFYLPHTPYVAPKKWFELYPLADVKLPELSADDRARSPAAAYVTAKARPEQDRMTDEQRRLAIQAYRASTSFMDAQLGRLLDAVDRLGLANNTVIVFCSDHGYHLGDHGLWQKRSLFERGNRVPLIIALPGAKANGRGASGIVEMLDLYPTLAALAGLDVPDYIEGVNLRPMLDDADARVKDAAFSQVGDNKYGASTGYSVRYGRWRYSEWDSGESGAQLYDEEADPAETNNLVNDPAYEEIVARLRARLVPIREQRPAANPKSPTK